MSGGGLGSSSGGKSTAPPSALALDRFGSGAVDAEEAEQRQEEEGAAKGGGNRGNGIEWVHYGQTSTSMSSSTLQAGFREGAVLGEYCTLGVGGPARLLVEVHTEEELAVVLRYAADEVRGLLCSRVCCTRPEKI